MFRKILVAALGGALALSLGAAGAYFTAQVQVPENIVRAGNVGVSTEPTSAALSIDALAPGTTALRSVTVVNSGALPADMVLTVTKRAGITAFYNALTCKVTCQGTTIYEGLLSEMRTSPVRLSPGARGEMQFEVGLPASAGNSMANNYVKMSLHVDAMQAH